MHRPSSDIVSRYCIAYVFLSFSFCLCVALSFLFDLFFVARALTTFWRTIEQFVFHPFIATERQSNQRSATTGTEKPIRFAIGANRNQQGLLSHRKARRSSAKSVASIRSPAEFLARRCPNVRYSHLTTPIGRLSTVATRPPILHHSSALHPPQTLINSHICHGRFTETSSRAEECPPDRVGS